MKDMSGPNDERVMQVPEMVRQLPQEVKYFLVGFTGGMQGSTDAKTCRGG